MLVELFDALGNWLADGDLAACQIGFGDRSYTLAPAADGHRNDPTAFLLERTIQLQRALNRDSCSSRRKVSSSSGTESPRRKPSSGCGIKREAAE
jgi:hypothetical protein